MDGIWMQGKSQGHHRCYECFTEHVYQGKERYSSVLSGPGHACICLVRCLLEAILQGDVLLSHSWCCWSRGFSERRHGFKCYYIWLLILYHSLCCSSHRRY